MKKEQFKVLKERLELSENFREQYQDKWKDFRDVYENKHYKGISDEDRVVVPFITGLIRTIIPSVFTRTPKFWVFSRNAEYKDNTKAIEKIGDYWWNDLKLQKITKRALLNNLVTGYSCIFYAYLFMREKNEKRVEDEEGKDTSGALTKTSHRSFRLTKQGEKNETFVSAEVVEDRPYFERLDPIHDILIDPMATRLNPYNGRYAIRIIRKTEEEVKEKFPKAKKQEPDSTIRKEYIDEEKGFSKKPLSGKPSGVEPSESKDSKIFTLYEYWDKDKRVLFLKEMNEPLEESDNPYWNKIPFIFSENYERESAPYPIGEVEMAEPMTKELDKTRSQIINHRKRFNRKYGYDKNHVDDETMAALEHPEDGTLVPVDGMPNQVIMPIQDAPLPSGVYENEASIKNDFQYVMANFDYSKGGRQTATEVREIADTSFSRRKEKMQAIEELSTEIMETMLKLLQFGWEKEDTLPFIDDETGQQEWVDISPDTIKGDYIFKFQQGSTEPLNEELMMKRALDVYNLFALDQSGEIDSYELKKWVLQTLKVQNISKILPEKQEQDTDLFIPQGEGTGGMPQGQQQGQQQALSPTATELPRMPQPPSPTLSKDAMQENPTNVANLLRGQGL